MSISENYRQLLKDVGLDDDFIKYLGDKYLFNVELFKSLGERGTNTIKNGATIYFDKKYDRDAILDKLKDKVADIYMFYSNVGGNEINFLKTKDRYDILRIANTNGSNCDIENEDIIEKLKEWEREFDFRIIGASDNFLDIEIVSYPQNEAELINDIRELCPDFFNDEDLEDDDLFEDLKNEKSLYFSWD